jgi:hypothetical protein
VRKPFSLACSQFSLPIWLGVEKTGQLTLKHPGTVTIERLEGVCDGAVGVDEGRSAVTVKGLGSGAIVSDGAEVFVNQSYTPF